MCKEDINLANERVTTTSFVLNIDNNANLRFDIQTNDSATRAGNGNKNISEFNEDNHNRRLSNTNESGNLLDSRYEIASNPDNW